MYSKVPPLFQTQQPHQKLHQSKPKNKQKTTRTSTKSKPNQYHKHPSHQPSRQRVSFGQSRPKLNATKYTSMNNKNTGRAGYPPSNHTIKTGASGNLSASGNSGHLHSKDLSKTINKSISGHTGNTGHVSQQPLVDQSQIKQSSSTKRSTTRRVGNHVLMPIPTTHHTQQTQHPSHLVYQTEPLDIDYSKFENPQQSLQEKSNTQVQYEVSSSRAPNLNLSTYGYSVNAIESTRRKAIQDAIRTEGAYAVQIRLLFLIKKYKSEEAIVQVLSSDFNWAEDIGKQSEKREERDRERNKSRMRIYQRMQEKSKRRK